MIDTNVSLSRWPFRRLPHDEPASLVTKLRSAGITQAWVGSFDGLLHKDVAAVNRRLARDCRAWGEGMLVPFGSVNPVLPDWEQDLRRCSEEHRMPGIRLHPNYHGYTLRDPRFARLLALAAERRMLVQVALAMEDERTQHPLITVPPVDPGPLGEIAGLVPGLRLVVLNRNWSAAWPLLRRLSESGQVFFEFSMLEGIGAVARLLREASWPRVLLGSHFPFYYLESALLKVREAGLSEEETAAVQKGNAQRLMGGVSRKS